MKTIIIEDENNSRELLQNLIELYCPNIQIIAHASSVETGYSAIVKHQPELVFLDIKMADGSGFDLLGMFNHISFQLIFTTAYQEFAIQAFQFSAIDYLLKPISPDLLVKSIHKALQRIEKPKLEIEALLENQKQNKPKKIVIKTNTKVYAIRLEEILRMESDSSYTTVYLKNGDKIMAAKQLKEYEEILSTEGFMRIHQSHLINLEHLFYIHKGKNEAILNDETSIPISLKKKSALLAYLSSIS